MDRNKNTTLYCFSPPVMIATIAIELSLLVYLFLRYKLSPLTRVAGSTLICLAIFQLAEYNVCQGNADTINFFSRLGFISIALLPALGIHIIHIVSERLSRVAVLAAYLSAAACAAFFGLGASAFQTQSCSGNYVIFHLAPGAGGAFFIYYYFWLVVGIAASLYYAIDSKLRTRKALIYQALGYLSFLLPTAIVNSLKPETINGIPSVMCGFALVYALLLVVGIVPAVTTAKDTR